MIIDCIADCHGHYPKLEGGDLLIVAGDCLRDDSLQSRIAFFVWLQRQKYKERIYIAGNHDNAFEKRSPIDAPEGIYLCDSGTEFEYDDFNEPDYSSQPGFVALDGPLFFKRKKLKIWGSPWTLKFEGMNPHCMAFTVDTEEELAQKWALIPDDTDILVTHSPPRGIADTNFKGQHCGSKSLYERLIKIKPRIHVFGHIHECGYRHFEIKYPLEVEQFPSDMIRAGYYVTHCLNASHVNERYEPANKPIRIEL